MPHDRLRRSCPEPWRRVRLCWLQGLGNGCVVEDKNGNPVDTEPCPDCQPAKRQAWLEEKAQEAARKTPVVGDLVVVKSVCQLCTVELWATDGTDHDKPVVLVRSVADGAAWWVELADVEKVSAEVAGL